MSVRTPRTLLVLPLVIVAVAASGCSSRGSEYQFLRSRSTGTYVKVPRSWDVAKAEDDEKFSFVRAFHASAVPTKGLPFASDEPGGFVRVRRLTARERDDLSFDSLRDELVNDLDAAEASGDVKIIAAEDLRPGDGFRGQRIVFTLVSRDESPDVTVSQTTLVDSRTSRLHLLVVGCRSACFTRNTRQIETVVESLTLKEP
ncbi:MAG TPA: hypothetical protein VF230_05625 [Acidimicrobiales bacterium]